MAQVARKHYKLLAWQEAMELVTDIYSLTKGFPVDERYGLTSQMRRAAVSVPSNIAEGAARRSRQELKQFLMIARGSLSELDTQFLIAANLGFILDGVATSVKIDKLFGTLGSLLKSLDN